MQVLLVTGGRHNKTGLWTLDSTEILEGIAGTWRLTAPLPSSARFGLSAASVENNIFMFGENTLFYSNIVFIKHCQCLESDQLPGYARMAPLP